MPMVLAWASSHGPSIHGPPKPCPCLLTTSVLALLLRSHPMLAPACAHPGAFATLRPIGKGLCGSVCASWE